MVFTMPPFRLTFDNRFLRELPGDSNPQNHSRLVHGALWSPVQPTPVSMPRLTGYSADMLHTLGLTLSDSQHPDFASIFSGNQLLPGMQPYATCYGGHQFGQWAGQLGDGRAIYLGEVLTAEGTRWELQLKGAGPTPYSRRADGRAVLRSSLREFLCSEAMYHLNIPTTRALSLVTTGDSVIRDMLYDGHPQAEPGAIVCRVAPSFIRFGHFELPAQRQDFALLERLVQFTIDRDYPHLAHYSPMEQRAIWFMEICTRTAQLLAHWMRVGFVHGVMNTDNMSILGLTLDYGPYGWLEDYNPQWTPNTTDEEYHRYSYSQQPGIGYWNLQRLADALAPLFPDVTPLRAGLQAYIDSYEEAFSTHLANKLGLSRLTPEDQPWLENLFNWLYQAEMDWTLFFQQLALIHPGQPDASLSTLQSASYNIEAFLYYQAAGQAWLQGYLQRQQVSPLSPSQRQKKMQAANPRFVLRNYLAQQAIDQAVLGDYRLFWDLLDALHHPYAEQPRHAAFNAKRPEWARHKAGCSMLSCSS